MPGEAEVPMRTDYLLMQWVVSCFHIDHPSYLLAKFSVPDKGDSFSVASSTLYKIMLPILHLGMAQVGIRIENGVLTEGLEHPYISAQLRDCVVVRCHDLVQTMYRYHGVEVGVRLRLRLSTTTYISY